MHDSDQEAMKLNLYQLSGCLDVSMAIKYRRTVTVVMMISFHAGPSRLAPPEKSARVPAPLIRVQSISQIVSLATEARMKGLLPRRISSMKSTSRSCTVALMLVVIPVDSEGAQGHGTELEQLDERRPGPPFL